MNAVDLASYLVLLVGFGLSLYVIERFGAAFLELVGVLFQIAMCLLWLAVPVAVCFVAWRML